MLGQIQLPCADRFADLFVVKDADDCGPGGAGFGNQFNHRLAVRSIEGRGRFIQQ